MVNKHVLRRICSDISSYMMKNVTFWIVENNPSELFAKENLIVLLQLGLELLKGALKNRCLPYYLIPKRNLFIGRRCLDVTDLLIVKLEEIIADCHGVIMRLPKVYEALTKYSFEQLIVKGNERDTLECLELKRQYIIASYSSAGTSREEVDHMCWNDRVYRETRCQMYDTVWSDWKQYFDTDRNRCSLETVIASMDGFDKFPDQYRRFARSYCDIIWPHIKKFVHNSHSVTEEEIIDFLAILRVKVEIALS